MFSLTIELTQLIMTIFLLNHRFFDATDLITNTIGGCIGYFILSNLRLPIFKKLLNKCKKILRRNLLGKRFLF